MNNTSEWIEASTAQDRVTPVAAGREPAISPPASAVTARLEGFDLDDRPLLAGLAAFPHRLVAADATIPLERAAIGRRVVVLLADGEPPTPIVIGVLGTRPARRDEAKDPVDLVVRIDGERRVIEAEREIVLRCGDASITLTRAGKVIIEGTYIVSRSTGYNRIKGAAVDIN